MAVVNKIASAFALALLCSLLGGCRSATAQLQSSSDAISAPDSITSNVASEIVVSKTAESEPAEEWIIDIAQYKTWEQLGISKERHTEIQKMAFDARFFGGHEFNPAHPPSNQQLLWYFLWVKVVGGLHDYKHVEVEDDTGYDVVPLAEVMSSIEETFRLFEITGLEEHVKGFTANPIRALTPQATRCLSIQKALAERILPLFGISKSKMARTPSFRTTAIPATLRTQIQYTCEKNLCSRRLSESSTINQYKCCGIGKRLDTFLKAWSAYKAKSP